MHVGGRAAKDRLMTLLLALVLAVGLPVGVAGCGCAAALLSGDLVAQGDEFVVPTVSGQVERVKWPFGYGIQRREGTLVLTNILGGIIAKEGDHVELGVGEVQDGVFGVCGDFKVNPST